MTVTTDTCVEIRKNLWLASRKIQDFAGTETFTGLTFNPIERVTHRRIRFLKGFIYVAGTAAAAITYSPFAYVWDTLVPIGPPFTYATTAVGDARWMGAEIKYGGDGGFIPEYLFAPVQQLGNIMTTQPKAIYLYMSASPTAGDDAHISTWIEVEDEVVGATIDAPTYQPTPVQSVRIVEPRFRDILTKRV